MLAFVIGESETQFMLLFPSLSRLIKLIIIADKQIGTPNFSEFGNIAFCVFTGKLLNYLT